jgi:hypothetical protein
LLLHVSKAHVHEGGRASTRYGEPASAQVSVASGGTCFVTSARLHLACEVPSLVCAGAAGARWHDQDDRGATRTSVFDCPQTLCALTVQRHYAHARLAMGRLNLPV